MLTIQNFSKTYPGGKQAVDDLSLTVEGGEIFGFLGHNGAGKTTTLRAVAGVMDFSQGTIEIGDCDIQKDPIGAKRLMAFLPDNPDLYEFLTGIQYLNLIANLYDIPVAQRGGDIEKYAGAFALTSDLGAPVGSYSHGMKQKLALISAFIRRPKLLILDEPFVGLDPVAAHQLKGFLTELCQNGGAVFFSTHVLEVAEKLCHRVGIIQKGKLLRMGVTKDIVGDTSLEEVFLALSEGGEQDG